MICIHVIIDFSLNRIVKFIKVIKSEKSVIKNLPHSVLGDFVCMITNKEHSVHCVWSLSLFHWMSCTYIHMYVPLLSQAFAWRMLNPLVRRMKKYDINTNYIVVKSNCWKHYCTVQISQNSIHKCVQVKSTCTYVRISHANLVKHVSTYVYAWIFEMCNSWSLNTSSVSTYVAILWSHAKHRSKDFVVTTDVHT